MPRQAKLIEIQGQQEEYADLIGLVGKLQLHPTKKSSELNWFNAGSSGFVQFTRKKVTENDGKVSVQTSLGNTFIFRLVETK